MKQNDSLRPRESTSATLRGESGAFTAFLAFATLIGTVPAVFAALVAVRGFQPTRLSSWGLALFALIFLILSLAFLQASLRAFIGWFGPRWQAQLDHGVLRPEERATFWWERTGGSGQVQSFSAVVIGESEQLLPRRKCAPRSEFRPFFQETLYLATPATGSHSGRIAFTLPKNALHALPPDHLKVQWRVRLQFTTGPGWMRTFQADLPFELLTA